MTTADRLLEGIKESASRASIARPFEIDILMQGQTGGRTILM